MMSKKSLLTILFVLFSVVAVIIFTRNKCDASKNVVRVGVILPLTGASSDLGVPILNAMKLAQQQLLQEFGGEHRIELDVEDGHSTATGTIAAYQKLLLRSQSALIVFGDVPCSTLAPLAQKGNLPVVALGAAASDITTLCDKYFRMWVTSDSSSAVLSNFLKSQHKSRIAIIRSRNSYGEDFSESLEKKLSAMNLRPIVIETYDVLDQDVKPQIQKICMANPDAVVVLGFGNGYLASFNQLREYGYSGVVVTDDAITIPAYYAGVVDQAKGIFYSSTDFDAGDQYGRCYAEFTKPFFDKHNMLPNAHSMFGYLAVKTLAKAFNNVAWDKDRLMQGLAAIHQFDTMIGSISYDKSRELTLPIKVKRMIGNGKSVIME